MTSPANDLLLLAGKILTIMMQAVLAFAAAGVMFAFFGVAFFADSINAELRAELGPAITDLPAAGVLGLLALALLLVAALFVFLGKLRGIIASVGEGDPFAPENADRLTAMAWLMVGVYLLTGAAAAASAFVVEWVSQFEDVHFAATFGFDFGSILLIIVLFILARVFRHGAAMREDLEGTV
jgi:hypothetical protein